MKRRTFAIGVTASIAQPWVAAQTVTAGGTIVVGQSVVLSGPVGEQLKVINAGVQLAFDQANRAGGIRGRKLQLVSLDDKLQPELTVANCEVLVQEHRATVLFGFAGSANLLAAEPVLRKSGVPLVGAFAVADSVRLKTTGGAYYVRAGYEREAERITRQLHTLGIRNVAVVHFANVGGEEVKGLLHRQLEAVRMTPVVTVAAKQDGSNLAACVAEIAAAKPQAVVMFIAGSLPAKLIAGLDAAGVYASFYGLSLVPAESTAAALSGKLRSLVISQVMPYPWSETDAATVKYRALATAAKVPIGYTSYEGYATGSVLVEALKKADRDLSPAKIHAAVKTLKSRIAGIDIDFTSESNTGSRLVEIVHVSGTGRYSR